MIMLHLMTSKLSPLSYPLWVPEISCVFSGSALMNTLLCVIAVLVLDLLFHFNFLTYERGDYCYSCIREKGAEALKSVSLKSEIHVLCPSA